jgi:dTDP-glucose pyrophosphorylase
MKNVFIKANQTVKEALKLLDKAATKTLLVVDDHNKLLGTISDGDIRRYILTGDSVNNVVSKMYNPKPSFLTKDKFSKESLKQIFLEKEIELIPIVDNDNVVVDYITWSQTFSEDKEEKDYPKINIPVVIMSGGIGTRLEPFTKIFPKSLFPVGEKTITEIIISNFTPYSVKDFYLTLNYKGSLIESYFNSIVKDYNTHYIKEKKFLGTAGSLRLLKDKINGNFILSNCDIIVKARYDEVLVFHEKNDADITILSSIQHYMIPYGVVSFNNGGNVLTVQEKPEYTFTINTGVYIINSKIIEYIPEDERFDMNHLITKVIDSGGKVITYPVNENDYIDIGQWEEYKHAVNKLGIE